MRSFGVALVFRLLLCGIASAQSQGYLFFAPGQFRAAGLSVFAIDFGGGGKFISRNGLGAGADLGMVGPREHFFYYDRTAARVSQPSPQNQRRHTPTLDCPPRNRIPIICGHAGPFYDRLSAEDFPEDRGQVEQGLLAVPGET